METPKLITRTEEKQLLEDSLKSDRSEFVTICGRRRVGKTFLVENFFQGKFDFKFVGSHDLTTRRHLQNFRKAIQSYFGKSFPIFNDWFAAFDALEECLGSLPAERKKIIFIDEMPWIDSQRSDFVSALENFWNGWAERRCDIVLLACGSASSWMTTKLFENQGGFHNRVTLRLVLKPFTLRETKEYLLNRNFRWDEYQILQCYMFTGGVPFYLSQLKPKLSIAQNIDELYFSENAVLQNEFEELFSSLFPRAENYIRIVKLLYKNRGGLTRNEISETQHINGTYLKTILKNLELCGFISKRRIFGKSQKVLYWLSDHHVLFSLYFQKYKLESNGHWLRSNLDSENVLSWMNLSFKLICLTHYRQIIKELGTSGMATSIYTWKLVGNKSNGEKGAQVDMVIERADRIIHLCEIKFLRDKYKLTAPYEDHLRTRSSVFKEITGTRYSVVHTFITTYGVLDAVNKSIIHTEITLQELFNS